MPRKQWRPSCGARALTSVGALARFNHCGRIGISFYLIFPSSLPIDSIPPIFMDQLNEKCGIFGIFGKGMEVARITFYGLFALQHRGQESSGIAVGDGTRMSVWKKMGLVTQV